MPRRLDRLTAPPPESEEPPGGDPGRRPAVAGRALYRAVLLAAGLVAAALVFQQLVTLFVAVLITIILAIPPAAAATRLERYRVPRPIGALLGLLAIVGLFAGVLALVIPPVVDQAERFIDDLPQIVDAAVDRIAEVSGARPGRVGQELQSFIEGYVQNPERLIGPIASVGLGVLAIIAGVLFVLITAYYMAVRPQPLVDATLRLFPPEHRGSAAGVMERLRRAWIGWMQGVAADMLVTGVLLYAGLAILDVEFALLFAVFSAVLVVVPYFGAILGGIPPVLFALTESPGKALLVLGVYILVQQIEGNVIVPLIMAERVKLHPAAIAVGVVVVAQLLGVIGLFVAVPIISSAVILTEELWVKPRERRSTGELELPRGPDLEPRLEESGRPHEQVREPDGGAHAATEEEEEEEEERPHKLNFAQWRFLAILGLPAFALALSITMVTTYLPVFIEDKSGPAVTGLLIGTEGLLALFLPLLIGSRSDRTRTRFGRRMPYLLAAAPVAAVTLVLMPAAGSLLALAFLLVLFYAAYFTYYSPYYALYPDLVPRWARGRSQGAQNTLREIGLAGALVGGGVLLALWEPLPFLIGAIALSTVTLAFVWRVEEREADDDEPATDGAGLVERIRSVIGDNRGLRWTAVATALWEFTLAALKTFVVLFFTVGLGRSTSFASLVLAIVAGAVMFAALTGGALADRFGHVRLLRVALWVYGLGLLVPFFWHEPWVLALLPAIAFAAGVVMTLPFALMMGMMPAQSHGAAAGLYGFSRGVGVLLGPVVAGVVIHALRPVLESTEGYAAVFLVASAGILASIPTLRVISRESG